MTWLEHLQSLCQNWEERSVPRQLLCICRSMLPPCSRSPKATRETLLLPISSVLRNMATLLPWQVTEQHSSPAPHLHQALWPVTFAPHLQSITHTPTSLCSYPETSSAYSAKSWPTYRCFEGVLIYTRLSKWLLFHLCFLIGKGRCLEMLLGQTFPKLCQAWCCTVPLLGHHREASSSLWMLSALLDLSSHLKRERCLVLFLHLQSNTVGLASSGVQGCYK